MGGLLICASTTFAGYVLGARGGMRLNALLEFKKSLIILKSEMEYAINPLPTAFMHIAEKMGKILRGFYNGLAKETENTAIESAWEQGIKSLENNPESAFAREDLEAFISLGAVLGMMDYQAQSASIDMAITYIDEKTEFLNMENLRTQKMFRGLGILCGLLITVILI